MVPKVSCICPTRGRFDTLRQAISFFLLQDYPNKELIIFNNHEVPIEPHPKLAKENVKVINGGSYEGKSMESVYADALKHISPDTEFIAVWDDDDMYLPWHLSSNIEKLIASDKLAIRAHFGYWQDIHNSMKDDYIIVRNTLEASMIARKGYIFFPEHNTDPSQPAYTHPHTAWVSKLSGEGGFLFNSEITANFRWGYGKTYPHLQSVGPHKHSNELGIGELLRPAPVKHLFFDLVEKIYLTTKDTNIVTITSTDKVQLIQRLLNSNIEKFEHIGKYDVWMYWNSPTPPAFIKLCHESIKQNTYTTVNILNDEMLHSYNLPEFFKYLNPVHRSDYLRVFLLNNFGGFWFDSDTYVLGDLDEHYLCHLMNHETVFPWEYDVVGNMTTPIFSSKPYGVIIQYALKYVNEYLSSNPEIGWSGIGVNGIMKSVNDFRHRGEGYFFGLSNIAKFGYNNHRVTEWDFEHLSQTTLNMIIFHWSQIGFEMSDKINITTDTDNAVERIIEVYPNFRHLFQKQHLPYKTIL